MSNAQQVVNLPKLYRPVLIEFSSLRDIVGMGGVTFDVDTMVKRKLMRVASDEYSCGWKWSIAPEWDVWLNETDLTCLNDCDGPDNLAYMAYVNPTVAQRINDPDNTMRGHVAYRINGVIFIDRHEVDMDIDDAIDLCETMSAPCHSCGNSSDIECNPWEFIAEHHYCGSQWCMP